MTVSYTASVATCRHFGCFWRLLFRWKASIYKLIWPNMLLFLMFYTCLSLTYRFALNPSQRKIFEDISIFCEVYRDMIPVSFVLGFYVSIVVKRWGDQYQAIPWPDPLAVLVSVHVTGNDTRSRLMRRTVMRYVNVALVMTFRLICPTIKKKFPTMKSLADAGYLLNNELEILIKLESKTVHPKYWVPIVWAAGILSRARREKIIRDDMGFKSLVDELNRFRHGCLQLFSYDWISIPLVYTQVVTLAVYSYFLATLMATQYLDPSKGYPRNTLDLYVPVFAILQFFFFMGWLLVAESLVNPFGCNDDDIEVNWIVERNLQVSYLIVDEVHEEHPKLLKDPYWDDVFPPEPPVTRHRQNEPYLGSTWEMQISKNEQLNKSSVFHSKNPTTQASKITQMRMARTAQFEASSRRVPEKESTAILKSIKSRILNTRYATGLGVTELAGPTNDVENKMSFQTSSKSTPGYTTRVENTNNVSNANASGFQDYHSKQIVEQLYQETPPPSWHSFAANNSKTSNNISDTMKFGKMTENYHPISRSIHQPGSLNAHGSDRQPDLHRLEQDSNKIEKILETRTRLEAMDRNLAGRCIHYMSASETPAPSTTLYTINEEKDQVITNLSETGN